MSTEKARMNHTSPAGKIEREQLWHLQVKFWPILTEDGQAWSINRSEKYHNIMPYDLIDFNLQYDHQLIHAKLTDHGCIDQRIRDDKDILDHELLLWISNKKDGHTPIIDGRELSVCVACEISVEGAVISNLLTGGGLIVLGENERPVRMSIRTPIYRWLLSHKNAIYKPYVADPVRQAIDVGSK